ncbi:hypothetical protein FRACYDRAFT_270652 [Fragilariopsis cylindrus CCMP1102]|uniref:Potassium channel tetramerisation-type BTB domain-containing protein n=1 Tax=Fragilariopsis cylindrus CCMP1102 TaxID=635003 RepID=A0A1E7F0R8_9STRA|nr:hypothetical protein FRACYDRAFT_270652 [Fragilariopsis cylindrus CCMP1102]|eukprot:OEU11674.1 hypothetical protein FRACYDRAFT_270652 [Fragilariopsis cylindrus CCMP1102]
MNDDGPDNVDGEEGGGATAMDTTATATSTWNLAQLRRRANDADVAETALAESRKEIKVLKEEKNKLQNEIATMSSVFGSSANVSDDDFIEIDVGGKIIRVLRSTLCLAPDTMLAYMFSGRWDDRLTRDNDGHVLLDHDPELIEIIINFLRKKKREDPSDPVQSPPKVREEKKEDFISLLDYYGLSDFFYPPPVLLPLDIANIEVVHSNGSVVDVTKSVDKIQFTNASRERAHWFVACKPSLDVSEEGSFWKVTIDVLPYNHRIYLGIIGNIGASNFSCSDSTSYGWGCSGQVYHGGLIRGRDAGWTGFTEGECLYFHLKSNKLTMFSVDKNREFVIDIATTAFGGIATTAIREYYIHFNFQTARTALIFGAKISLEPLSDEERKLLPKN